MICFVIGGLSVFSILWSLDKGAYINITLVGLLFLLFVRNKKHQAFFILIGLAVSWLIFYTTVGSDEFNAFISNTVSIIKTHDFLNAIVYPTPFSFSENDSARGTRNLLIIIINGIFIISALVNKKNNIPKSTTFFLLIFYTLAFINYKSGISRSDGPHMKQSIYFHLILLVTFFSFYLLNFIKKFDLDNKFTFLRKRFYIFFPLLFLILVIDKINPTNLKNIVNFKNRYLNYVQLSDENFLSNKQVQLVKKLKNLHLNENCIQTFTYESAIPYLIKKKSCTKFYVIYVIGSKKNQHNFIDKLKATKPKYILTDGPYEKYTVFSPKERFPYIFKYLQKNYQDGEKLHSWKILNLGS